MKIIKFLSSPKIDALIDTLCIRDRLDFIYKGVE